MEVIDRMAECIRYALDEMDRCKDDSIQDIFNEQFEKWEVPYRMKNGSYIVDKDV